MSSLLDDNVILFGDVGPDVVKFSQIYDPDNDEYALSKDGLAKAGKTYYVRHYSSKTVSFTKVNTVHVGVDTPEANGWYEANISGARSTGKYVPAPKSVVVVDQLNEDYDERTLLIVDSVDDGEDGTLKSKLVPINYGAEGSSARSLKYANGDYMLYFERDTDLAHNVRLIPDRRLMLYGSRYYMYRLVRNNIVISTPTPEASLVEADASIPYVGVNAKQITLTANPSEASYYANYGGSQFDTLNGFTFHSIEVPRDSSGYIPTFDAVYKSGVIYFLFTQDHFFTTSDVTVVAGKTYYYREGAGSTYSPYTYHPDTALVVGEAMPSGRYEHANDSWRQLTAGTDYTVGAAVGTMLVGGNVAPVRIQQQPNVAFAGGVLGWLNKDDEKHVFYPGDCYLKSGFSIVSGETVDMEVYELRENSQSLRLIMNVTLTTKESSVLDGTNASSKKVNRFGVKLQDEEIETDVWQLGQEQTIGTLLNRCVPTITFDDGSTKTIALNNPGLFVYGANAVNTATVGQEFPILFKYFPNETIAQDDTPYINSNTAKRFLTCRKTVRICNLSSVTVRKITTIPLWNHNSGSYQFRYAIYRTDFSKPIVEEDLGSVLTRDEGSGAASTYLNDSILDPDADRCVTLKNAEYLDEHGIIRPSSGHYESILGYIQHATLAVFVKADNYINSVYDQPLAVKLQNWETASIAAKWLIGDTVTTFDENNMPYGNPNNGIRPYLEFNGDLAYDASGNLIADASPFRVGAKFTDKNAFLQSFYTNANPPLPTGSTGVATVPNYFMARSFMNNSTYYVLQNADPTKDVALEEIVYYDRSTGKPVSVVAGETIVTDLDIKVQADLTYYGYDPVTHTYTEATGLVVGAVMTVEQRKNLFICRLSEVNSGYVSIDGTGTETHPWLHWFRLWGTYTAATVGGSIPFVFGDNYNTQVMGCVLFDLVHLDAETGYKHLYGVPVEVKFPYKLTTDTTYKYGVNYYTYGWDMTNKSTRVGPMINKFFLDSTDRSNDGTTPIPYTNVLARWELDN